METLAKWNKCIKKDSPKKSVVNVNPLYKEIPDTGNYSVQGEPLVNIRGNHLQMGTNYIRKPLIYGNSCKVNALFNKGAHPRPSLFGESNVHLKISKPSGKPKKPKQSMQKLQKPLRKQSKTTNKSSDPCQPKWTWVWRFCFVFWVSRWCLIVVALTSLVVLVSLVFPVVLMFSSFCIVCLSVCLGTIK